jgi:hypothetical protein
LSTPCLKKPKRKQPTRSRKNKSMFRDVFEKKILKCIRQCTIICFKKKDNLQRAVSFFEASGIQFRLKQTV